MEEYNGTTGKKLDHFVLRCNWHLKEQDVLVLAMQTEKGTLCYCRFVHAYRQLHILKGKSDTEAEWIDLVQGEPTRESRYLGQQIDAYYDGKKS